jgi:WS/DGAT/MGAT family acyltransferase
MRIQSSRYERLSPRDASFLAFEKPDLHMHIGLVAFFEAGSFRLDSGAIDLPKFQRYIASRLPLLPRCRQKLAYIPLSRQPVWVDDASFTVERHVREVTLAAPGEDELQRLAGDLFSVPLDRGQPLWELSLVQGLGDPDRFALICKVHHAMIDGIAGIDFMGALLTPEPGDDIVPAAPGKHRPAPARCRLLVDEARRWAGAPRELALAMRRFVAHPATRAAFREQTGGLVRLLARGMRGTSASPLRERASATRSFAWTTTARSEERSVRSRLGGSRDDVALTAATGAVRTYLQRHGADPTSLRVRAMAPMSLRSRAERGLLGNRVSLLIVELPVGQADPARRLASVRDHVVALKESKQVQGVEALEQIDRWTGTLAQSAVMWIATRFHSYNVMITNVPGPPVPLYAVDARLLAIYPLAPIFDGHHISIAAFSYLDTVHWGIQYGGADLAEAQRLADDLRESFDALVAASASAPPRVRVVEPPAPDLMPEPRIASGA